MRRTDALGCVVGVGPAICLFAVHAFVSMTIPAVVTVFASMVIDRVLPSLVRDAVAWALPFAVGFVLGFFPNRTLLRRESSWVWVPGLLWLAAGIWSSVRYYDPRWSQGCSVTQDVLNAFIVMGDKCEGGESGLAGLFFTMPAFSSIAYSLGALIALRMGPRSKNVIPSPHST